MSAESAAAKRGSCVCIPECTAIAEQKAVSVRAGVLKGVISAEH